MKNSLINLFRQILIITGLLGISSNAVYAAHLRGGQMTYECIDPDPTDDTVLFEINCTIFRDVTSAKPNPTADFGIYEEVGPDNWVWIDSLNNLSLVDRVFLPVDDSNQCEEPSNFFGVDAYVYIFNISLPISANNYMIAYQRCCRDATINNIVDPSDTGVALSVEITPEAQATCDNSPIFNKHPPVVVYRNQELQVDYSATDIEGDILRYSFCAPKTSGGTDGTSSNNGSPTSCTGVTPDPANCLPPFSDVTFLDAIGTPGGFTWQTPLAGEPIVSIDPDTGMITGVPEHVGQFVLGVCVQAFRDGVLIAEINRDFQLNVIDCISSVFDITSKDFYNLQVYPNPTDNDITVNIPDNISASILSVRSLNGQQLLQQEIDQPGDHHVSLTNYENGVYIIELVSDSRIYLGKVVKVQ